MRCAAPGIAERRDDGAAGAALVVGLGGGALPVFLQRVLRMDVDVVELDAAVVGLARQHFGFTDHADSPRLAVRPACLHWVSLPTWHVACLLMPIKQCLAKACFPEARLACREHLLAQQLGEGCHDTQPHTFPAHTQPAQIRDAASETGDVHMPARHALGSGSGHVALKT